MVAERIAHRLLVRGYEVSDFEYLATLLCKASKAVLGDPPREGLHGTVASHREFALRW